MRKTLLSAVLGVWCLFLFSGNYPLYGAKAGKRPKIGVVLSGGGAKGFAHIPVLRTLEELNIPVDYIGGTSMGSTVAALYAMGYSVDELEKIARDTNWYYYFQNRSDRENESLRQKLYFKEYPFTFDISSEGISVPRGFVNGQRIGLFLSRLTWEYQHVKDFHKLPVPFLCVATDFEKGEGVVFDKGNIAESLRASMAIPSVFNPVEIDDRVFLDGGVVNNFPVKEVREMGADIIIGIDVSGRLYKKDDLDSLPKIMEQSISFLGERKTMEQRKLCDILIIPEVNDMGAQDFGRTDEILKRGEKATQLQMDKLIKLSKQLKAYNIGKSGNAEKERGGEITAHRIFLHGLGRVSKSIVKQYLDIEPGDTVTPDKIDKGINAIYGLNFFERIRYDLESENGINSLHIYFIERPESHLYFGVAYDTDVNAAALLGLQFNNAGLKNSELILKGRFGDYSRFEGAYLVYTPIDPGVWIELNSFVYNLDFNYYSEGKLREVYDFWHQATTISLNTFYSNWILLSFGMRKEFYFIDGEIIDPGSRSRYEFDILSFYAMMKIDTLDDYTFPRKGFYLRAQADYVTTDFSYYDRMSGTGKFERNMVVTRIAIPLVRRFAFQSGFSASSLTEDVAPPSYWFAMGGYQRYEDWIYPLNGYELMEKTGRHGWVYYLDIQYEPFNDFFITVKWNEGKVVDDINELYKYRDTDAGYGFSLGYRTPFGPMQAGVFRKAWERDYSGYFNIGFVF
jgi:NTE family protein